jgi:hypothetical protein
MLLVVLVGKVHSVPTCTVIKLVQGQYIPVRYVPTCFIRVQYVPFYIPMHFIPEVRGPYSGLGLVRLNAQPIHGLVEFGWF